MSDSAFPLYQIDPTLYSDSEDEEYDSEKILVLESDIMRSVISKLTMIFQMDYFDWLFDAKLKPFKGNYITLCLPTKEGSIGEFEDGITQSLSFTLVWQFDGSKVSQGKGVWFYPFNSPGDIRNRVDQVCEILKNELNIKDETGSSVKWTCSWDSDIGYQFLIFSPKDYYVCSKTEFDFTKDVLTSPILKKDKFNAEDNTIYLNYSEI